MTFIRTAYATCPICVVTVGGGLWIAKKLGVDDLIAAIWIGALTTAFALSIAEKGRILKLPKPRATLTVIFYITTILTLQVTGNLDGPHLKIWGVNKIWLGTTIGTIAFLIGFFIDRFSRSRNNKKVLFPFQKIVIPTSATIFASLIFYFLI